MKKFRFRLATLRKLREAHRDEMRSKLAEAYQATQMLEDQIKAVKQELVDLQDTQRNAIENPKTDMNGLLQAGRYQAILQAQQSTMEGQVKLLATEVERRRQVVVEADRQVRVLDKLEERQKAEHLKKMRQAEVKELDEIGSLRVEVENTWAL